MNIEFWGVLIIGAVAVGIFTIFLLYKFHPTKVTPSEYISPNFKEQRKECDKNG